MIYDTMSNDPLHLNFEVAFSDSPIDKSHAVRERSLLTFASIGFELNSTEQDESETWLSYHFKDYKQHKTLLAESLSDSKVSAISLTAPVKTQADLSESREVIYEATRVRVRLDFFNKKDNILEPQDLVLHNLSSDLSKMDEIAL